MPYKKAKVLTSLQPLPIADHPSSSMRGREPSDVHLKLNEDLRQERNRYFEKLIKEREEDDDLKTTSAIKIQALFRGYISRPRHLQRTYRPVTKPRLILSKLHEELCIYASQLNLKPIPGLNIETYRKTSKRKKKIENAAAFLICRFFMMIFAKKASMKIVYSLHAEKKRKAATVIYRFFKYIRARKEAIERAARIRAFGVILIQKHVRRFVVTRRVCHLRRRLFYRQQVNDAAVIIQRSLLQRFGNRIGPASPRENNVMTVFRKNVAESVSITNNYVCDQLLDEMIDRAVTLTYDQNYEMFMTKITNGIIDRVQEDLIGGAIVDILKANKLKREHRRDALAEDAVKQSWESILRWSMNDILESAMSAHVTSVIESFHRREQAKRKLEEDIACLAEEAQTNVMAAIIEETVQSIASPILEEVASSEHRNIKNKRIEDISSSIVSTIESLVKEEVVGKALIDESSQKHDRLQGMASAASTAVDESVARILSEMIDSAIDASAVGQRRLIMMATLSLSAEEAASLSSIHETASTFSKNIINDAMQLVEGKSVFNESVAESSIPEADTPPSPTAAKSALNDITPTDESHEGEKYTTAETIAPAQDENINKISIILALFRQGAYIQVFNTLAHEYPDIALHASSSSSGEEKNVDLAKYTPILVFVVSMLFGNIFALTGHLEDAKAYFDRCNAITLMSVSADSSSSQRDDVLRHALQFLANEALGRWYRIMAQYDKSFEAYFKAQAEIEWLLSKPSKQGESVELSFLRTTIFHFQLQNYHLQLLVGIGFVQFDRGMYRQCGHSLHNIRNLIDSYEHSEHIDLDVEVFSDWMFLQAKYHEVRGEYHDSESILDEVISTRLASLGFFHPLVSKARSYRGEIMLKLGQTSQAGPIIQESYQHRRKSFLLSTSLNTPVQYPDEANGSVLRSTSVDTASGYRMISTDEYNPDISESLNAIGKYYLDRGEYVDAYIALEKAAIIREKVFGNNHVLVAESFMMLGTYFLMNGLYKRAEIFCLSARDIISTYNFQPSHLHNLSISFCLASLAEVRGDYLGSYEIYSELVKTLSAKQSELKLHKFVLLETCRLRQANISTILGDYSQARESARDVGRNLTDILGDAHIEVANSFYVRCATCIHTYKPNRCYRYFRSSGRFIRYMESIMMRNSR
jgi:tetratricopeptide (TPR) repeat protein